MNTTHSHPYMTRSKCSAKSKQIVTPYITYSDSIKLYMNKGVADDSYVSAEYEDAAYLSQTSETSVTKKRAKVATKAKKIQTKVETSVQKYVEEVITKIEDDKKSNKEKLQDDMLLDDYVLL